MTVRTLQRGAVSLLVLCKNKVLFFLMHLSDANFLHVRFTAAILPVQGVVPVIATFSRSFHYELDLHCLFV